MRTLVVGGTGMIGGHAALLLRDKGFDVTIAGRKAPPSDTPMAKLPFVQGDFAANEFDSARLTGYEAIVFAAGNDFRHVSPGADQTEQLMRANVEGVPHFFRQARQAGVHRAVYVGTLYSHTHPELGETIPYVKSRIAADEGARATNAEGFAVITLNAPMIVGQMPGLGVRTLGGDPRYALGLMPELPVFAPAGGSHFMSLQSMSEAILGALLYGTPGKAYLVGDQNMTFKDYLQTWFDAAGRNINLQVRDEEHPLIPASWLYTGLGSTLFYDIPPEEADQLGYTRNDVSRAIHEIVSEYKRQNSVNLPAQS